MPEYVCIPDNITHDCPLDSPYRWEDETGNYFAALVARPDDGEEERGDSLCDTLCVVIIKAKGKYEVRPKVARVRDLNNLNQTCDTLEEACYYAYSLYLTGAWVDHS